MTHTAIQLPLPGFEQAQGEWRADYSKQMAGEQPVSKKKGATKTSVPQTEANGDTLKRKADPVTEDTEKPLSKREQKRRAKKARLEGTGENAAVAS